MSLPADDPVLSRRRRVRALVDAGQRLGYLCFGVAVVAFFVALGTHLSRPAVVTVVAALAVGSAVLAPAIVFGYAVKAAEREDRAAGRLP